MAKKQKVVQRSELNTDFVKVIEAYEKSADPEKALEMSPYMRNKFEFLGISAPRRRSLAKKFIKTAREDNLINWDFIDYCWARPEREFQYLAIDYLDAVAELLKSGDLSKLKRLITTKSWWDTVDSLDKIIGDMALNFPGVGKTMLLWSKDENIWLRRIAIDHQLQRKEKTDTNLLREIIINNLEQKEFFINKAIGWALRDYSKTNSEWVKAFVEEYKNKLAPLSLREASTYFNNYTTARLYDKAMRKKTLAHQVSIDSAANAR